MTAAVLRQTEWQLHEAPAGEFEIDRLLGWGGMGAVFLATEVGLGRQVALKVLLHERPSGAKSIELPDATLRRVSRRLRG